MTSSQRKAPPLLWGMLLHPTSSMWRQRKAETLVCDPVVWDKTTQAMADAGLNTAVIDLGDAVMYESHPEIAVKGAWTRSQLCDHLDRLRDLGLRPVPKLNFSTVHGFWMGDYARMVSSPAYYQVCSDLIAEVTDLFDTAEFFHLGLDEESIYTSDPRFEYVIGRRRDLWWHDALFLIDEVAKTGARPWVWCGPMNVGRKQETTSTECPRLWSSRIGTTTQNSTGVRAAGRGHWITDKRKRIWRISISMIMVMTRCRAAAASSTTPISLTQPTIASNASPRSIFSVSS